MLEPQSRMIYLDQIRPPQDYVLDRALATTFSLDLLSLLMAPLSMVFESCHLDGEELSDPIAIMEALHQTTDRFGVFCQQGRILIPKKDSLLFPFLEKVVVEMQPTDQDGSFHPKTWFLRFTGRQETLPILYRFICLSRNLTFDKSWDTILTLEGFLDETRTKGFSRNRPLAYFLKALSQFYSRPINPSIQGHLDVMTEEIPRVRFESPEGFDEEIEFLPSGIPGYQKQKKPRDYKRLMVLSPFLSDGILKSFDGNGKDNLLISRLDSLEALNTTTLEKLAGNFRIYFMDPAAEWPEELFSERDQEDNSNPLEDRSGLHAKLLLLENGSQVEIITGSANLTEAAFSGKNIEFMVRLTGKKKDFGIEAFLGEEELPKGKVSFRNLIQLYSRGDKPNGDKSIQQELEKELEGIRKKLTQVGPSLSITPSLSDSFLMELHLGSPVTDLPLGLKGSCYPITLNDTHGKDINVLFQEGVVQFNNLSSLNLTGFMAFILTIDRDGFKANLSFVLNLPAAGMPENRQKEIIHHLISDPQRFLRFLLFILADRQDPFWLSKEVERPQDKNSVKRSLAIFDPFLMEELIRAFSRKPEKLERIARLVDDLKVASKGKDIFPEGFEQIWQTFQQARDL